VSYPAGEWLRLTLVQPLIVSASDTRAVYARSLEGHCMGITEDKRMHIEVMYASMDDKIGVDVTWLGPLRSHIMSIAESTIAGWYAAEDPRSAK